MSLSRMPWTQNTTSAPLSIARCVFVYRCRSDNHNHGSICCCLHGHCSGIGVVPTTITMQPSAPGCCWWGCLMWFPVRRLVVRVNKWNFKYVYQPLAPLPHESGLDVRDYGPFNKQRCGLSSWLTNSLVTGRELSSVQHSDWVSSGVSDNWLQSETADPCRLRCLVYHNLLVYLLNSLATVYEKKKQQQQQQKKNVLV